VTAETDPRPRAAADATGAARPGPPVPASSLLGPIPVPVGLDPTVLHRLDGIFYALRRMVSKPVSSSLPVPGIGRQVDLSKVMVCEVLAVAADTPGREPLTVKDLATALQLDHSTTSRLASEAEAEGFVTRGSDPEDRRRTTVSLTDLGRAVAVDSAYIRTWFMGRLLSDWDPADMSQLVDLLTRAIGDMGSLGPRVRDEAVARLGLDLELPLDC
jgi:DNA-binding MarR family transcriptional regulator